MFTPNSKDRIILHPTLVINSKTGFYVCLVAFGSSRNFPEIEYIVNIHNRMNTRKLRYLECDRWTTNSRGKKKIVTFPLDMEMVDSAKLFNVFIDHYKDKMAHFIYGCYDPFPGSRFMEYISSNDPETIDILSAAAEDIIKNLKVNPIPKAFVMTLNLPFAYPKFSIGRKLCCMEEFHISSGIHRDLAYRRLLKSS